MAGGGGGTRPRTSTKTQASGSDTGPKTPSETKLPIHFSASPPPSALSSALSSASSSSSSSSSSLVVVEPPTDCGSIRVSYIEQHPALLWPLWKWGVLKESSTRRIHRRVAMFLEMTAGEQTRSAPRFVARWGLSRPAVPISLARLWDLIHIPKAATPSDHTCFRQEWTWEYRFSNREETPYPRRSWIIYDPTDRRRPEEWLAIFADTLRKREEALKTLVETELLNDTSIGSHVIQPYGPFLRALTRLLGTRLEVRSWISHLRPFAIHPVLHFMMISTRSRTVKKEDRPRYWDATRSEPVLDEHWYPFEDVEHLWKSTTSSSAFFRPPSSSTTTPVASSPALTSTSSPASFSASSSALASTLASPLVLISATPSPDPLWFTSSSSSSSSSSSASSHPARHPSSFGEWSAIRDPWIPPTESRRALDLAREYQWIPLEWDLTLHQWTTLICPDPKLRERTWDRLVAHIEPEPFTSFADLRVMAHMGRDEAVELLKSAVTHSLESRGATLGTTPFHILTTPRGTFIPRVPRRREIKGPMQDAVRITDSPGLDVFDETTRHSLGEWGLLAYRWAGLPYSIGDVSDKALESIWQTPATFRQFHAWLMSQDQSKSPRYHWSPMMIDFQSPLPYRFLPPPSLLAEERVERDEKRGVDLHGDDDDEDDEHGFPVPYSAVDNRVPFQATFRTWPLPTPSVSAAIESCRTAILRGKIDNNIPGECVGVGMDLGYHSVPNKDPHSVGISSLVMTWATWDRVPGIDTTLVPRRDMKPRWLLPIIRHLLDLDVTDQGWISWESKAIVNEREDRDGGTFGPDSRLDDVMDKIASTRESLDLATERPWVDALVIRGVDRSTAENLVRASLVSFASPNQILIDFTFTSHRFGLVYGHVHVEHPCFAILVGLDSKHPFNSRRDIEFPTRARIQEYGSMKGRSIMSVRLQPRALTHLGGRNQLVIDLPWYDDDHETWRQLLELQKEAASKEQDGLLYVTVDITSMESSVSSSGRSGGEPLPVPRPIPGRCHVLLVLK